MCKKLLKLNIIYIVDVHENFGDGGWKKADEQMKADEGRKTDENWMAHVINGN